MSVFAMEKWYFDIVTSQGDFVVLYFAYVRFTWYFEGRFNIQIAPGDGQPVISATIALPISARSLQGRSGGASTPFEQITINETAIRIAMHSAQTTVDLDYDALTSYDFARNRLIVNGKGATEWRPLHLRSRVSGTITLNGRTFKFDRCDGYIDYVRSTIFPLWSPVDELFWGRIHHDRFDLTFTYATNRSEGTKWGRIFVALEKETYVINDFSLTVENLARSDSLGIEYPLSLDLKGSCDSLDTKIHISRLRNAMESRFIDQQHFGKGIKNRFYEWVSRNPRGFKFTGQAKIDLACRGNTVHAENIPCVYEYVRFG